MTEPRSRWDGLAEGFAMGEVKKEPEVIKHIGEYRIIGKENPHCHEGWCFPLALTLLLFALFSSLVFVWGFLTHTTSWEIGLIPFFAWIGFVIPFLHTGVGVTLILIDPTNSNAILRSCDYRFSESTEKDVVKLRGIVDSFTDTAIQRIKTHELIEKNRKERADLEEKKKQTVEINKEILKKQYKTRMEMLW